MIKVASLAKEAEFIKYDVKFPADWEVRFVDFLSSDEEMIKTFSWADYGLLSSYMHISGNVIKSSPHLKMIQADGIGFNGIDIDTAKELGIPVCNNRGANVVSVAEHCIGLMLTGLRRTTLLNREIREMGYEPARIKFFAEGSHELRERHVGLIGIGAIGKEVAYRLKNFGCRVSYYDVFRPSKEQEDYYSVDYLELEELISTCNIISIHVPALPSTINMLSEERFKEMSPDTLIINAGRGEIINTEALCKALEEGWIYGACIDTPDIEPIPEDHPFFKLSPQAADKLILTPHMAGQTDESLKNMLEMAIRNIQRHIDGEKLLNVVNGL